jgi:hypothetical protein
LRRVPRLTVEEAHRRGGLPLVPEIDASATLDRLERLTRESTELHEELDVLGIVPVAMQRLGQPTAIERLFPLHELVRGFAGDQQRADEWPLRLPGCS